MVERYDGVHVYPSLHHNDPPKQSETPVADAIGLLFLCGVLVVCWIAYNKYSAASPEATKEAPAAVVSTDAT